MEKKNALVLKITLLLLALLGFAAIGSLALSASMALTALLMLALMTSCFSSVRLSHTSPLFFLIGIPVFEIVWLISRNILLGLFSLVFLPAGFLLARSLKKETGRTASVLTLSALFGGVSLVFLLILYKKAGFALSELSDRVAAFFNTLEADLLSEFGPTIDAYIAMINEQFPSYDLGSVSASYLFDTVITLIKSVAPAVFVCAVNLFGFAAFYFGLLVTKLCGYYPLLPVKNNPFLPSPVSASVFLASYVIRTLSSFFGGSSSAVASYLYVVTMNLVLILLPFFLIMGIKGLSARFLVPQGHRTAVIMLVITLVTFLLNPAFAFYILSFLGAFDTLAIHRITKAQKNS